MQTNWSFSAGYRVAGWDNDFDAPFMSFPISVVVKVKGETGRKYVFFMCYGKHYFAPNCNCCAEEMLNQYRPYLLFHSDVC